MHGEFGHFSPHQLVESKRVRTGQLVDRHRDGWLAIQIGVRIVGLRTEFHPRNVLQADHRAAAVARANNDVFERAYIGKPAWRVDLQFEFLVGRRWRLTQLAACNLLVLFGDGGLHLGRRHAECSEAVGFEPDPHRVALLTEDRNVASAFQALERIDKLQVGIIAEPERIHRAVRRNHVHQQRKIGLLFLDRDAALIHDRGQIAGGLRYPVLHIDRRDIDIVADIERDGDLRRAVIRTDGRHVSHALHPVKLLFQRCGHRIRDDLRACAGICCADNHLGWCDGRELRHRQEQVADGTREHHDDRDNTGKDRTCDEEIYHGRNPPGGAETRQAPHATAQTVAYSSHGRVLWLCPSGSLKKDRNAAVRIFDLMSANADPPKRLEDRRRERWSVGNDRSASEST